ncbi:MAG: hypothetical protein R3298_10905, partial [Gammaproteobacteria bacterium]|nr:hypothetical protein [Gammaproteobacteria bacterium]
MAEKPVCWRCGAPLRDDLPRIFPRLEKCLACGSDLHVCRQCRFYAPQYTTKCSHDRAEPAREVDVANFCAHFRLRTGAYAGGADATARARDRLDAMFGAVAPGTDDADGEPAP